MTPAVSFDPNRPSFALRRVAFVAANLTPGYRRAEAEYRRAGSIDEQIEALQRMLREVPKHKGTDRLQADIKSRLREARLAAERERRDAKSPGRSRSIPRQGAARVTLVGPPDSGKSLLATALSGVPTTVAPYPYATQVPQPVLMPFEEIAIQLIDTPPASGDRYDSELQELVRGSDLVLAICDARSEQGLDEFGRLLDLVRRSKSRFGRSTGFSPSDLGVTETRTLVLTFGDPTGDRSRLEEARRRFADRFDLLVVGLLAAPNEREPPRLETDSLPLEIYRRLDLIRVYTRAPEAPTHDPRPIVLRRGATAVDLAASVHRQLAERFRSARLSRPGNDDSVIVGREHELQEGDVLEIRT